jgi:NAD(P)-dependent dehydrogenase (short-subunit alcohol dehydrogenase family)
MRFQDKVAIITGGAGGIGRATAQRFASEGATVVINDVDDARIAEAVAALDGLPGRAVAGRADVTSEREVGALVDAVVRDHGGVDILINNAGGMLPGAQWSTVADCSLADWNSFLALNLTGPFIFSRAVLPSMVARGRGHIVSVSSISAVNGQVAGSAYAAAKAGLTGLTASLAKEVAAKGINVNGIIIGNAPFPNRDPERQALLDSWVHVGRVGQRSEFAAVIAFLCSEDASYMSGTMVPVDGGFHRFNLL